MTIDLYPFQRQIVNQVQADWRVHQRNLVQSPTGTGKTIMMLALTDEILRRNPGARIGYMAHTDELVTQPGEKAAKFYPHLARKMGVFKADQADLDAPIVVMSVMTLAREQRRAALPEFDYILDDECHRSIGATRFNALTTTFANARVAGFTAWPRRTDKVGLGHVYDHLSWRWTLQDAIEQGYLAPFHALGFSLPVSFQDVRQKKDGSFDDGEAATLLDADNIIEIVYRKWVEHGAGRKTMGFAPSVAMAQRMAEYFTARGHNFAWVSGETPRNRRREILDSFEREDPDSVQGVFNRFVLTEGYDNPLASCLLNVAPTGSSMVTIQRLGRVLRKHPSKEYAQVLDFCPTNARLVLPKDVLTGEDMEVNEAQEKAEKAGVMIFDMGRGNGHTVGVIDPDALVVEILNYTTRSRLPWSAASNASVATVGDFEQIIMANPDLGALKRIAAARAAGKWSPQMALAEAILKKFRLYRALKVGVDPETGNGGRWVTRLVGVYDSVKEAGKDVTTNTSSRVSNLGERNADWRKEPATDNQLRYMRKLGVDSELIDSIAADEKRGKGRAGRAITAAIAAGRQKKAEQETLRAIYGGKATEIADLVVGWEEFDE